MLQRFATEPHAHVVVPTHSVGKVRTSFAAIGHSPKFRPGPCWPGVILLVSGTGGSLLSETS